MDLNDTPSQVEGLTMHFTLSLNAKILELLVPLFSLTLIVLDINSLSNTYFSSSVLMMRDRNWRPDGGEWEPIKISFEIDPSAYIPKITTNPQILDELWSSYRRAKPTQITPRNERETRKRSRKTADLTVRDRSDHSL